MRHIKWCRLALALAVTAAWVLLTAHMYDPLPARATAATAAHHHTAAAASHRVRPPLFTSGQAALLCTQDTTYGPPCLYPGVPGGPVDGQNIYLAGCPSCSGMFRVVMHYEGTVDASTEWPFEPGSQHNSEFAGDNVYKITWYDGGLCLGVETSTWHTGIGMYGLTKDCDTSGQGSDEWASERWVQAGTSRIVNVFAEDFWCGTSCEVDMYDTNPGGNSVRMAAGYKSWSVSNDHQWDQD
jgi:hypothetical protein